MAILSDQIPTPHFKLPFHFETSASGVTAEMVEQDTIDEIADCVEAIVRTPLGFRIEALEFGIPDPAFAQGLVDVEAIRMGLLEQEPRAETLIERNVIELEQGIDRIVVGVSGSAITGRRDQSGGVS